MPLSFVTVNIEKRAHLEPVLAFLEKVKPDVLCLQELFDDDLRLFKERLGMEGVFSPMVKPIEVADWDGRLHTWGIGILSRNGFRGEVETLVYEQYPPEPNPYPQRPGGRPQCALLTGLVEKEGESYRIATTHFTWTEEGQVTEEQCFNLEYLLSEASVFPELILCGDFNAPRGRAIFDELATLYTDNIPAHITTSLDPVLHRAGPLPYMVDGLFSTPHYKVEAVELVQGVSDHCAVKATISLAG